MTRPPLLVAVAMFLGLPLAIEAEAAIPMFNGTCPGGLEVHADEGGPVYVNGRDTQIKRFSDDYFEARDSASGVTLSITRSADGEVQMSYTGKGGVNGICAVGNSPGEPHSIRGASGTDVTCESEGQGQAECEMDTHGDVQLVRQLSRTECVQGENWGLYHHSVWVKDGCRAVFRTVSGGGGHASRRPAAIGAGAELLGACNLRAKASGALVTRVPVNDDVTELIIDYPDGRFLCMVRNDGLVESLTRLRGK